MRSASWSPAARKPSTEFSSIVATTFQPASWNAATVALPKPEELPVMNTVLIMVKSFLVGGSSSTVRT